MHTRPPARALALTVLASGLIAAAQSPAPPAPQPAALVQTPEEALVKDAAARTWRLLMRGDDSALPACVPILDQDLKAAFLAHTTRMRGYHKAREARADFVGLKQPYLSTLDSVFASDEDAIRSGEFSAEGERRVIVARPKPVKGGDSFQMAVIRIHMLHADGRWLLDPVPSLVLDPTPDSLHLAQDQAAAYTIVADEYTTRGPRSWAGPRLILDAEMSRLAHLRKHPGTQAQYQESIRSAAAAAADILAGMWNRNDDAVLARCDFTDPRAAEAIKEHMALIRTSRRMHMAGAKVIGIDPARAANDLDEVHVKYDQIFPRCVGTVHDGVVSLAVPDLGSGRALRDPQDAPFHEVLMFRAGDAWRMDGESVLRPDVGVLSREAMNDYRRSMEIATEKLESGAVKSTQYNIDSLLRESMKQVRAEKAANRSQREAKRLALLPPPETPEDHARTALYEYLDLYRRTGDGSSVAILPADPAGRRDWAARARAAKGIRALEHAIDRAAGKDMDALDWQNAVELAAQVARAPVTIEGDTASVTIETPKPIAGLPKLPDKPETSVRTLRRVNGVWCVDVTSKTEVPLTKQQLAARLIWIRASESLAAEISEGRTPVTGTLGDMLLARVQQIDAAMKPAEGKTKHKPRDKD